MPGTSGGLFISRLPRQANPVSTAQREHREPAGGGGIHFIMAVHSENVAQMISICVTSAEVS